MNEHLMTVRAVVNCCYGGFHLSKEACRRLWELGVRPSERAPADQARPDAECFAYWMLEGLSRTDPRLIQVVEELGPKAAGPSSELRIVETSVYLEIEDYDGKETAYARGGQLW